eukprot:CAMPEP_0114694148 /NCGR_PEP_ID=MMETSP0191-20121206/69848_1 /TAXON_ID=126664 /ORGANISM="Sorites sp." /LENGTH=158 /DNA_ID=CAMNT_0001988661 /DNA_START=138 /DNA_END=611 /DNA_ORIENTATION=-
MRYIILGYRCGKQSQLRYQLELQRKENEKLSRLSQIAFIDSGVSPDLNIASEATTFVTSTAETENKLDSEREVVISIDTTNKDITNQRQTSIYDLADQAPKAFNTLSTDMPSELPALPSNNLSNVTHSHSEIYDKPNDSEIIKTNIITSTAGNTIGTD